MTELPAAYGYVRNSKAVNAENLSQQGMADEVRACGRANGFDVVEVFVDDGKSGAVRNRPEFLAWLETALDGRAHALVSYHADRMTREGVNVAARILDVVEGKDPETGRVVRRPVRFLSTDGLDSRDEDAFRWRFVIAAEVARGERNRIVSRNTDTQRRLREAGRFRGGQPPYGYRVVPHPSGSGKGLALEPTEAGRLRAAAEFILDGGSLYGAAQMLRSEGVRTRTGRDWSVPGLKHVLTSDATAGRQSYNGTVLRDESGLPLQLWEPALPPDLIERVRAALAPSGQGPGTHRRKRATRLLSGRLVCSECGCRMRVNRSGDTVRYACAGLANNAACSRPLTINAPILEAHVEAEFLRRYGRFEELRPVTRVRESVSLADVEASLRALSTRMIEPGADVQEIASQIGALQARRVELEALPVEPVTTYEPTGRTVGESWDAYDLAGRRDLLDRFLTGPIVVRRGTPRRKGLDLSRFNVPWIDDSAGEDYLSGSF